MTKDELKALLPTDEVEIRLEDVEGLPRNVFINERDRFEKVQEEYDDDEEPWPDGIYVIGYGDFLGDPVCVNIETKHVVIISHETFEVEETLSTSVKDWLLSGGRALIEQQVILSSLGDEEVTLHLFTTAGARIGITLMTKEDATQLQSLSSIASRYVRIGYDKQGNWVEVDLDEGYIRLYDETDQTIDVIRSPLETVLNWVPSTARLLFLTQRLNRGEISKEELPSKRQVPTLNEMIEWILYVKAGRITREDVSDWAGQVLQQSDDELNEGTLFEALLWLSGIDLLDDDGGYLHDETDLDEWILQLEARVDEEA